MRIATSTKDFIVYYPKKDLEEARRKVISRLVGYIGDHTTESSYNGVFMIGEGPGSRYIRIAIGTKNAHLGEIVDNPKELSKLEADLMEIYSEAGFVRLNKNKPIGVKYSFHLHAKSPED